MRYGLMQRAMWAAFQKSFKAAASERNYTEKRRARLKVFAEKSQSVTNPKFAEQVTGQKWEDIEKKICTWVTKDAWKHFCKADCGYKIKYAAFRKADMHIWFGDKGTYDRSFWKISEKQIPAGVCYQMKVVKNCGHGGLFSEPKRMLKAITAAGNHEKRYVI